LANTIALGVSKANRKIGKQIQYIPWEFNDIAGNPLISPILDGIEASKYVVADITYLNANVIYEIGFAIGKSRRCFLLRHSLIEGDKKIAGEAGIFDTLGYEPYRDDETLSNTLCAYIDPTPLPIAVGLDRLAPVYVVESPTKGGIDTLMTSRLKKARYKYRSFNPSEDSRLSATDAIRQVAISSGVLLSYSDEKQVADQIHNIRSIFVAGLAHAMNKPTLILAHANTKIPLDIRDDVKSYSREEDIVRHIADFSLEITDYLQQDDPTPPKDSYTATVIANWQFNRRK
jgi:hypothetical protein